MGRGVEVVVDEVTGWKFRMPRLTKEDIERYGFGTWDLADWTFGTCIPLDMAIELTEPEDYELNKIDVLLWRIENLLRYYEWLFWLEAEDHKGSWRYWPLRALHKLFSFMRGIVFKLASRYTCGW